MEGAIPIATICDSCDKWINRNEITHPDRTYYGVKNWAWHQLEEAAAIKCAICTILHRRLRALYPRNKSLQLEWMYSENGFSITVKLDKAIGLEAGKESCLLEASPLDRRNLESAGRSAMYEYPRRTDASSVISLVRSWMVHCSTNHRSCHRHPSTYYPPRLLDVRHEQVRLIVPKEMDSFTDTYATLSHCWGARPTFLKLTSTNMGELCQGISLGQLPQNFSDAIDLCRRLGLAYLWIDSLCIIQEGDGSVEDWLYHVTEMRHIYQEATINIAASRAANAETGMYVERSSHHLKPSVIRSYGTGKVSSGLYLLLEHKMAEYEGSWHKSPLNCRGWVFQERLLSPRSVYFAEEQVHWECCEQQFCETYPAGTNVRLEAVVPGFSLPTLGSNRHAKELEEFIIKYEDMIHHFTSSQLTYPDIDTLPAFAGIAEHFAQELGDEYIAGMFRRQLPYALLWKIADPQAATPLEKQNMTYRCPSWSWTKADVAVSMVSNHREGSIMARVMEAKTTLLDSLNPFGRLIYAHLILRCCLIPCVTSETNDDTAINSRTWNSPHVLYHTPLSKEILFDEHSAASIDLRTVFILPIVRKPRQYGRSEAIALAVRRLGIAGQEQYERIGIATLRAHDLVEEIEKFAERDVLLV